MKFFRLRTVLIVLVAVVFMAGCGKNSETTNGKTSNSEKIKVITTFYPMYEFTKNVAGDQADVELLIPSSTEPHEWEPSPKDVANIQNADLFIYNSEYMETWVPQVKDTLSGKKVKFVEASKGITLVEGVEEEEEHHEDGTEEEEHHEGEHEHHHEMDPHVWLSPALAQKEVQTITDTLISADPDNKAAYEKNSKAYLAKLTQLDNDYRTELKGVKKKELITQHAAFGYLAKEYGLIQVPIAGLSPEQEPNAQKLAELKDFAKEHDVKVIYFEEITSPKLAKTLASEIGAKTEVLSTLEGLSEKDQAKGLDYIQVMEANLEKLVQSQ
ncbi:metal ABC transporter substrate-binding protein [Niallia sp. 03091]|uniref:metal ABC transporter substrate-binding protein n=1 Tax=unclassified Niallia TaxID=2837522 RepID=UPI004044295B